MPRSAHVGSALRFGAMGVALAWLALARAPVVLAEPAVIPLELPSEKVLQVEVMVEDEDRALGLMFRPSLPEDRGMLFLFDRLGFHGIWMKNCRFPIDIVWMDEEQRVVHVAQSVPPCEKDLCPVYEPLQRALYVLEMGSGQAAREAVSLGSEIDFELP